MRIGFTELFVVFIVALVIIGPDKLPMYMKKLGEGLQAFKKASEAATGDLRKSVIEPLEEAQKPLKEAMAPIEELDRSIKSSIKDVNKSLSDIGKGTSSAKKAEAPKEESAETAPAEKPAEAVQQEAPAVAEAPAEKTGDAPAAAAAEEPKEA